jgi:hypothetical protein
MRRVLSAPKRADSREGESRIEKGQLSANGGMGQNTLSGSPRRNRSKCFIRF